MEQRSVSPETQAAQGLGEADPASGGLAPVINLSTNYEQQLDGSYPQGRIYTRADNPTSEHAERLLAALEGCACACALFGSGMAAATAVFQSLLPGDHVLVSRVLYWGVRKWLAEFALTWGLDVEFTDTTDLDAVAAAIRPGRTRLLWVETPANPMWDITDLAAVCELGQAAGVRVAVDNTVATPVLTRPFEHGADLVVHSAPRTPDGPTFEETLLVTPSRLPEPVLAAALRTAADAARALGLRVGPVHAELRTGDRGPAMLELAPRPIGGLCSRAPLPGRRQPGGDRAGQRPGPRPPGRQPAGPAVRGVHAPGAPARDPSRGRGPCQRRGRARDHRADHYHCGWPAGPSPSGRGPVLGFHLRRRRYRERRPERAHRRQRAASGGHPVTSPGRADRL